MNSELNSRQWALYNYLKNRPDEYITQREICYDLRAWYPAAFADDKFHDSRARLMLTLDIRAINESDVIQKVIISNHNGVKIANSYEFEKYISAEYASIFRKLARTRKKERKGGLDGQMRIVFGAERDTVEAFSDSIRRLQDAAFSCSSSLLKAARLRAGLKLVDVARELSKTERGIDISLLSKMENGYCRPTESVLVKMAILYGVSAESISCDTFTAEEEIV